MLSASTNMMELQRIEHDDTFTHELHGEVEVQNFRVVSTGDIAVNRDGMETYFNGDNRHKEIEFLTSDGDEHVESAHEFVENTELFDESDNE